MECKKLTKSEFMKMYINDKYNKRLKEKMKDCDYYTHTTNNISKVKRRKNR